MEEELLRLRDSEGLTLEELEAVQETLEEKDDELRTKITMVKDEKIKAEHETERRQVQEAMVLVETRIDEIKNREQVNMQEQSGLSAYREEGTQEQSGLSAYREENMQEQSGLSAYHEENIQEQSGLSTYQEDIVKQEEKLDRDFYNDYKHAYDKGDIEAMKKIFSEVSIEAEKGNGDMLCVLADIFALENNSHFYTIKSRRLFNRAMVQGSRKAYSAMLWMLEDGSSAEQDKEKALECLEKAAELGSLDAIMDIADGASGEKTNSIVPRDYGKAMKYYKYYLDRKYGNAEVDSLKYMDGLEYRICLYKYVKYGIKAGEERLKDVNNLRKMLSLLLDYDDNACNATEEIEETRNMLGDALCNEKRYREAVSYWLEAGNAYGIKSILREYDNISEAGDGEALDSILNEKINYTGQEKKKQELKGIILTWKGDRCENDDVEAFKYYCLAAGTRNDEAVKKRDRILKKYKESNFINARAFYEESAEGGNSDAYKYLGDLYAADHNYENAMKYYRRGQAGTMEEICKKQAGIMKERMSQERRYKIAIDCVSVSSMVQGRREEGLNMIKQLAKEGFPEAAEYLKEHS